MTMMPLWNFSSLRTAAWFHWPPRAPIQVLSGAWQKRLPLEKRILKMPAPFQRQRDSRRADQ
jgi:hypothetical protein